MLRRAPPCSGAQVIHTCSTLSLGDGVVSTVPASSGRGEKAASELSAVLGFADFHTAGSEMILQPGVVRLFFASARGERAMLGRGV